MWQKSHSEPPEFQLRKICAETLFFERPFECNTAMVAAFESSATATQATEKAAYAAALNFGRA
jgi:hypothetical protein